jgi:hypothetical protein
LAEHERSEFVACVVVGIPQVGGSMTDIHRVRITSSGFPGGPGVTTFYGSDGAALLPALKGLCADFAAYMPSSVVFAYPVVGDIIDPLTGELTGEWTADARAGDTGTGDGSYAAPAGVVIDWETGSILDGHRLRGRSFFVPMIGVAFQSDGTVAGDVLSALNSSVNTHQTAMVGNLLVWHRPRAVSTAHPVARDGGFADVSSGHVPDKAAVLRSRRA